jgi:plastocyanin
MHRLARLTVGAVAAIALAGCGSGAATGTPGAAAGDACAKSTASGTVAASIVDLAFDPATVSAKVGDVITWTNKGAVGHTVTVDTVPACDSGTIAAGATSSFTFSVAGSYPFHCKIHSSMTGTVTVTG